MIPEIITIPLLSTLFDANKSMKIDEEATRKNVRAFKKIADSQYQVEMHQKQLFEKLSLNAKRKEAILQNHIKLFLKQYSVFHEVEFERGRGIEELEIIDEIQQQLTQNVSVPQLASGAVMNDTQLVINLALRGIGGLMIKESEMNLKVASQNLSKSNVVAAQGQTICIAMDGIGEKVQIITDLLQRLGALYMLSIRELERIVGKNGTDAKKYTQEDIDAINTSMYMTKLIYRIIMNQK